MEDKIIEYLKAKDPRFEERIYCEPDNVTAIINYYYYEQLKWCGCGQPRDAIKVIGKYLRAIKEKEFENRKIQFQKSFGCSYIYENVLLLCLAYALDAAEFTDHGSSINFPWLTDDGEYFLYAIDESEKSEEILNNI